MRILYVLLTRAREKLVLTASQKEKSCREQLIECALMKPAVADWKLRETRCHLDWVLAGLAEDATLHTLYATGFENTVTPRGLMAAERIGRWQLDALTQSLLGSKRSLKSLTELPTLAAEQEAAYATAFAALETTLAQRYPFEASSRMCAKYSVSALTHRDDEFSITELSGAFEAVPSAVQTANEKTHGMDWRLAGSAVHLVFEHLPLKGPVTVETVRQTLAALVQDGLIPHAVAGQIDAAGIAAFFLTEPGQAALTAGKAALREWPFTLGVDAAQLESQGVVGTAHPAECSETVIVQGIVDLIIPTAAGLIIADFKTDRIRADDALQQRIAHYRQPLNWYAKAASAILKSPIVSRWLYFVECRKAVQISD